MNRANYGRFSTALREIKNHPDLELVIVAGGGMLLERFGRAVNVVREDGFTVDEELYMNIEGETPQTMAQSVGVALVQLAPIISRHKPDIVVTIGDRYETLATAIAGAYMNVPVAHTQGGELTGTIDESVRHAVSKLAHIHLAVNDAARQRLLQMGENPEFVFTVGCPSIDLAAEADRSKERLAGISLSGIGQVNLEKPYLLVMQHPVTTEFGSGYEQMMETLEALKIVNMPTLMLWPNPDAGSDDISKAIRIFRERERTTFPIQFFKNIEPEDYTAILANATCAVGNSSSFLREGSFLGTPTVLVGNRQQHRDVAHNVVRAPHDRVKIADLVLQQIRHGVYEPDHMYGNGTAGKQIAEILATVTPPIQKKFFAYPSDI